MVNFSEFSPFQCVREGFVCLHWPNLSSAHWVKAKWVDAYTESMRTKTPRHLSQCKVFFFKCFSRNLPTHLSCKGRRKMLSSGFNFICTFAKIFENSFTPHWLLKLSLHVNWVDTEWTNFRIPWRIRSQNPIYFRSLIRSSVVIF